LILDDQDTVAEAATLGLVRKPSLTWLKKWAAQVTLTLTVDEKSSRFWSHGFSGWHPKRDAGLANRFQQIYRSEISQTSKGRERSGV
jgi:hypothetical protein